jgi:hypothetical protein
MARRRHGSKILGLAVIVALGLMAFSAAAAQGEFLILGAPLEQFGIEEETFEGHAETPFSFLVEAENYEINCPEVGINGKLLLTDADAKFAFRKCAVFSQVPLEEMGACHIFEPEIAGLTIFLNALILAVLHKTKVGDGEEIVTFLLAEPQAGNPGLGMIHLKKGMGCPLPKLLKVTGTIAFFGIQAEIGENLVKAGSEELQLLLGDELKIDGVKAHLDGTYVAELTGKYKGCSWGAI